MNNIRIRQYVEEIFNMEELTDAMLEQREEIISNLTERVSDYMAQSLNFDEAFEAAKNDVGDIGELMRAFAKDDKAKAKPFRVQPFTETWKIAALSPFIFIALGFFFGWWAWAWVIIPVSGVLSANISAGKKLISCSPFIFIALGFFFGWWAWAWIVIPVSAILFHDK